MDSMIIAPKPIRPYAVSSSSPDSRELSSRVLTEAIARFSLSDDTPPTFDDHTRQPSLPQDALEEFLGITRPSLPHPSSSFSFTTPHSSRSRTNNNCTRPHPYRRHQIPKTHSADDVLGRRNGRSRRKQHGSADPFVIGELMDQRRTLLTPPPQPRSSDLLRSPISRIHTRNPLPRHPSYDSLSQNLLIALSSASVSPSLLLAFADSPIPTTP